MRYLSLFRAAAVLLACVGMILPAPLLQAAEPPTEPYAMPAALHQINDVALQPGGLLSGQVLDAAGIPLTGAAVHLMYAGQPIAEMTTDAQGRFAASGVRGGVYQIVSAGDIQSIRAWAPNTAPPNAQPAALLVAGGAVRGQVHPLACLLANPWIVVGTVVAAVAIPVAIHQNRTDRQPSS